MSNPNRITSSTLRDVAAIFLAAAGLAARDRSSGSSSPPPSPSSYSSSSPHNTDDPQDWMDALSEYEWLLRYEAVRSRMGTFVLSRQTILEFLVHAQGDVNAAVRNLGDAHQRQYTGSLRFLGGRAGDLELPDRVRGFPIYYFSTGEQERRQAADLFFLLVAQVNIHRERGTAIRLARSEAVLILDASGWDLEEALGLVRDHRELATQLLHIRFDDLRIRSGSAEKQLEQDDAALAYYLTLTDRADMYTMQLHLAAHGGDIVAAIADWQRNGVDPVLHSRDHGQTQSAGWIGRRDMIQEDGHQIVLRPMPTSRQVHEYRSRQLAWAQEPHRFALTTTEVDDAQRDVAMRENSEDRKNRPYSFIIDYDRDALAKNCPNPRKFLIEYLEKGKYRSNGFDVINPRMKMRTSRYFWEGKGLANTGNKPVFNVNDGAHLKHFNGLYRQGYFRPTGILCRDPGTEWSAAELKKLWELYAEHYHQLLKKAKLTKKGVSLPFHVPEARKKEMAQEVEKVAGEERSANSVITMAHRHRQICKDFILTFDISNEVRRQTNDHAHTRRVQVGHVSEAITQEGESLSEDDILAALEQITGPFIPFEWDIDMSVDASPPSQQLPSTGLPTVSLVELRAEVQQALYSIPAHFPKACAWEQAAQVVRYYYRSVAKDQETAAMQPLLVRMGLRTLGLQSLKEEEGLAIFEGLARRGQQQEGRGARDRLNSLVTTSRQAMIAGPAGMPSGGQIGRADVESFDVGLGRDGRLTDHAIEAGLQTLALQNTTFVDMLGAQLHFDDPNNPLPAMTITTENVAVVMHFPNHWTVGIYNTTTQQYNLLDSMPNVARLDTMARQMDAIVAHYFPTHEPRRATPRSFRQNNGRDCGLYVIENIRAMDRGMPLREINGFEARMGILSEIMRLANPAPCLSSSAPTAPTPTTSMQADDDDVPDIGESDFEEDDFT